MALLSISKTKDVCACLTNFNYLYRIETQCDTIIFIGLYLKKLNFFEKVSIL